MIENPYIQNNVPKYNSKPSNNRVNVSSTISKYLIKEKLFLIFDEYTK